MNSRLIGLFTLASLLALPAAAENFYWSSTAASPGDWNTLSNWKTGGDSQYDPDAAALPVPGTDTVTFRTGTHVVVAPGGMSFGRINLGDGGSKNADVTFAGAGSTFTADPAFGFVEAQGGASFTLAGGDLFFGGREFYANSPAKLRFTGAGTSVSDLKALTFNGNADIRLDGGVHATNITLTLCPFDGSGRANSVLVSGLGTFVNGLTLTGRYWGGTNRIDGGAVVTNLLFDYSNQSWTADDDTWPETRFETENATVDDLRIGTFVFTQWPNTSFVFGPGSRISSRQWDPYSLVSSNGLLRVAGTGTCYTNFTWFVNGRDGRLEIADGAEAFTRMFSLGYGASGVRGTVSGTGTVWRVFPKEMKQEGVLFVGFANDGRPGSDCELVVEDGARIVVSDAEAYKNGEKIQQLLGILVGGREDSDGNRMIVRSGATVTNWFATSVGGGFTASSNAKGGANNLLGIEGEGTEFRGGLVYNDVWDSELYLGWETGYSNSVVVADGAFAAFNGCAEFGIAGGCRLAVDRGTLDVHSKVNSGASSLPKGPHVLEARGTNGTLRVGALIQDAGCENTDWSYVLRFGIPEQGRATDAPMIEVTGAFWDAGKNAISKGKIALDFDIDRHWAQSGRGKFATLLAVTGGDWFANGEQRWSQYKQGIDAVVANVDPAQLGGCRLSVVVDREDPEVEWSTVQAVRLVLESGVPKGTVIVVR